VKQNNTEIKALLNLIDDPNDIVFHHVSNKILLHGIDIIPDLEEACNKSNNKTINERIETLILDLQFATTKQDFTNWKNSKKKDLLKCIFLIAKYQYPNIKFESILEKINKIERDIWVEINDNLTALEKVRIINKVFFEHHNFSIIDSKNISPKDLYINNFLDTKKAGKTLIALVYIILANKLNIPIRGVLLSKNLILAYIDDYSLEKDILFYINPADKGKAFSKTELNYYIEQNNLEKKTSYYLPANNIEIIKFLLQELLLLYKNENNTNKILNLQNIINIIK